MTQQKPSATATTTTFNCEIDTTDAPWIKCVDQNKTGADIKEDLAGQVHMMKKQKQYQLKLHW